MYAQSTMTTQRLRGLRTARQNAVESVSSANMSQAVTNPASKSQPSVPPRKTGLCMSCHPFFCRCASHLRSILSSQSTSFPITSLPSGVADPLLARANLALQGRGLRLDGLGFQFHPPDGAKSAFLTYHCAVIKQKGTNGVVPCTHNLYS